MGLRRWIRNIIKEEAVPKQELLYGINRLIATACLHQETFRGFKNLHNDKDIVLVGAGPSARFYEPLPDALHVGLNRAFLRRV